uniref:Uncharacterized protein n=1 Tax=Rubinisphaera brasiliensis (strain ATCC 49424 / DSM 5305 / JCM 21570 / IAM 15109 / NBRC 103401 / IFAM 1448) TaxID=756272 RepID=F0SJ25_RUBBR|nr:hypothetical protein Plabr_0946 [Rubinisphaera brasiliensis DSM 5305]
MLEPHRNCEGPGRTSGGSVAFLKTQQFQMFSQMRVPHPPARGAMPLVTFFITPNSEVLPWGLKRVPKANSKNRRCLIITGLQAVRD